MNCPDCNKEMEEVEFSDGTVKPDGIPGVICHDCDIRLTIDDIDDEQAIEDAKIKASARQWIKDCIETEAYDFSNGKDGEDIVLGDGDWKSIDEL